MSRAQRHRGKIPITESRILHWGQPEQQLGWSRVQAFSSTYLVVAQASAMLTNQALCLNANVNSIGYSATCIGHCFAKLWGFFFPINVPSESILKRN